MVEAWRRMKRLVFERLGNRADSNFLLIEQRAGIDFELLSTGAADAPVTVHHGLGRVPQGMVIMNVETALGVGPVVWYREAGDDEWTEREMKVRFNVANAHVRLWIW